jgi:alpha-ribazole phosphatase
MSTSASQIQLHLLRHGKTTAGSAYIGSTNVALTELGWQQMSSSVEQYLSDNIAWDIIVSSPLQRCSGFAKKLADKLAVPLVLEQHLREYHFGDWENKTALEVMEQYPNKLEIFWQDPEANPPNNGEQLSDFSQRIDTVISQVKQNFAGKNVLLVCHGGVMRYLLSKEQQLPISSMLSFPVEHGQLVSVNL